MLIQEPRFGKKIDENIYMYICTFYLLKYELKNCRILQCPFSYKLCSIDSRERKQYMHTARLYLVIFRKRRSNILFYNGPPPSNRMQTIYVAHLAMSKYLKSLIPPPVRVLTKIQIS